ncbi:hypothetical protein [Bacillus thuringiensis]|nr:hypothetical protein [Bacillus thuringiensis]MEC3273842.1 hypothetical protein [Bacillus thuringiensis]
MKEFAFDKEKAIALAEQLGLTVKLNSDTPGIYLHWIIRSNTKEY